MRDNHHNIDNRSNDNTALLIIAMMMMLMERHRQTITEREKKSDSNVWVIALRDNQIAIAPHECRRF